MALIKKPEEIKILKEGGEILAKVVYEVVSRVKPGISTQELNELAEELILKYQSRPSFKNFNGYSASTCISVNQEVVHGLPRADKIIAKGDIVGVDIGLIYKGFYTDMAVTVPVGTVSPIAKKLIVVTREALDLAIKQARPGKKLGDIGAAVQNHAEKNGFSVVRSLVGHGVGHAVHEEPRVPNFGRPGEGMVLQAGMVLAIEPMVNIGGSEVATMEDGWTIATIDGSLSAHFEHTIAVTEKGAQVLTK